MDDLINRQAAIDAVMNTEPVFDGGGKTYQATADVISALTGLPSARPLDPCETCLHKSKGWDEEPCDGCTGTESKYKPDNGWIPVSERLPEKPNMYTVTDSKGDVVRFIFYDNESSREYWRRCAKAWMPLPEPYKEEA